MQSKVVRVCHLKLNAHQITKLVVSLKRESCGFKNLLIAILLKCFYFSNVQLFPQAGKAFRKFLPLFDRVLVERCAAETVTKGGIMIPEKAQGKVLQATVVAVGSGARGKVNILKHLGVRSSWKNVVGKGWLQRKF